MNLDYYLASPARTPVVIEIFAAERQPAASLVERRQTETRSIAKKLTVVPSWITAPTRRLRPIGGANRFVWDFHTKDEHGPLAPPGAYTVRLDRKRQDAMRARCACCAIRASTPTTPTLRAQYALAQEIEALRARVTDSNAQGAEASRTTSLPAAKARELRVEIIGETPPDNPDDSEGTYSHDFTSLLYLRARSIISKAPSKAATPRRRPI